MSLIGWAGNACFFGRFLVQWIASERKGESVTPVVFWWISVAGALLATTYLVWLGQPVLLAGQLVNLAIYLRNLSMRTEQRRPLPRRGVIAIAAAAATVLIATALVQLGESSRVPPGWLAVAVVGQSIWSSRFLVQWWSAEKTGQGALTRHFWWFSLAGNLLLLTYALHLRNAVLVAGYLPGPLVQLRNLTLHGRAKARAAEGLADAS